MLYGMCMNGFEAWKFQNACRCHVNRQNTQFYTKVNNNHTDPSKCINDQTLRSDREFCRTSHRQMSDQIVRQMSDQILPGRSESLHSQIVKL